MWTSWLEGPVHPSGKQTEYPFSCQMLDSSGMDDFKRTFWQIYPLFYHIFFQIHHLHKSLEAVWSVWVMVPPNGRQGLNKEMSVQHQDVPCKFGHTLQWPCKAGTFLWTWEVPRYLRECLAQDVHFSLINIICIASTRLQHLQCLWYHQNLL